jgi:predicted DNA-binding protein YlxM (UPF0122 family)
MNQAQINEIVSKYTVEKMTMTEIAECLGISLWNVHDKLHKANAEIRPRNTKESIEKMCNKNRGRKQSPEEIRKRTREHRNGGIGAKKITSAGYVSIYFPDHPDSKSGQILEHRLVMECILGRRLARDEVVHHINGIPTDNKKENLQLMSSTEHKRMHAMETNERRKVNGK